MIITRALYGLKTSDKILRTFFARSLTEINYKFCPADPDVYMKPERDYNGNQYWSYMLVYVNDCRSVHNNSNPIMEDLKSRYKLKGDSYGEPDRYLVANVCKYQLNDGYEY